VPVPLLDGGSIVGGPASHVEDPVAVHRAQRKLVAAEGFYPKLLVITIVHVPLLDGGAIVGAPVAHIEDLEAMPGLPNPYTWKICHGLLLSVHYSLL